MDISYVNLKGFSALEIEEIKSEAEKGFKKIKRDFKDSKLVCEVKRMQKAGSRCKYSVHLRLEGGSSLILAAHQADWDLSRALKKTLSNLKQEADHKYHKNNGRTRQKKF